MLPGRPEQAAALSSLDFSLGSSCAKAPRGYIVQSPLRALEKKVRGPEESLGK